MSIISYLSCHHCESFVVESSIPEALTTPYLTALTRAALLVRNANASLPGPREALKLTRRRRLSLLVLVRLRLLVLIPLLLLISLLISLLQRR